MAKNLSGVGAPRGTLGYESVIQKRLDFIACEEAYTATESPGSARPDSGAIARARMSELSLGDALARRNRLAKCLNPHSPDEPLNCTALAPIQI